MRVKFTRAYDYRISGSTLQNYPEGHEGQIPAEHAKAAIAAGAAHETAAKAGARKGSGTAADDGEGGAAPGETETPAAS